MSDVQSLTVTLPGEMVRLVRDLVEKGRYASDSAVICQALHALKGADRARLQDLASVRIKLDEAEMDPRPSLTDEAVERHFDERLRQSLTTAKGYA